MLVITIKRPTVVLFIVLSLLSMSPKHQTSKPNGQALLVAKQKQKDPDVCRCYNITTNTGLYLFICDGRSGLRSTNQGTYVVKYRNSGNKDAHVPQQTIPPYTNDA